MAALPPQLSDAFFESRQPAAVLKHAVLRNYLTPWAAKVGYSSTEHRVAIADCHAGAGRYADGSPGSPAIIADLAGQPGLQQRQVEAYFIERDEANYAQLQTVLEEDAVGIKWQAWQGKVEEHLGDLLELTRPVPLFLFLDPFGHGLSLDRIVAAIDSRRDCPATEALIRIDAAAVYRTRGTLHGKDFKGKEATLQRLDATAGGTWWRDEDDPELVGEQYLEWFMGGLLRRACRQSGYGGWTVDVRRKAGQIPVYYLLFLTRHPDGMAVFNESLSLATASWRRSMLELTMDDSLISGDLLDDEFKQQERSLEAEWHARLRTNLLELLSEKQSFNVMREFSRIFAGTMGEARQKHLRPVLKELYAEKLTTSDSKGDLYAKVIVRA